METPQEEFTVALRSLLNGLRLFYTDAVMPGDAELEVAIDQCFARCSMARWLDPSDSLWWDVDASGKHGMLLLNAIESMDVNGPSK